MVKHGINGFVGMFVIAIVVAHFFISCGKFDNQIPTSINSDRTEQGHSLKKVTKGVNKKIKQLRGRWDGIINDIESIDYDITFILKDFAQSENSTENYVANGLLNVGDNVDSTPIAANINYIDKEKYEISILGTVSLPDRAFTIKLNGEIDVSGNGVADDHINGVWQTSWSSGEWSATHHDRRYPSTPISLPDDNPNLYFNCDVYAAIQVNSDGSRDESMILEAFTNIVSSAVKVEFPDGSLQVLPFYTDIFSPDVDFIEQFRFVEGFGGLPITNGSYTFTLLDPLGNPIEGAVTQDTWVNCEADAPRNVSAIVQEDGIIVTWDPVIPTPGFYQIELNPEEGDGSYGASDIHYPTHLIPLIEGNPGQPDGNDFGQSLNELSDGIFGFSVIAFMFAPPASSAWGLECQIRASDEYIRFAKSGSVISILP